MSEWLSVVLKFVWSIYVSEFTDMEALKPAYTLWEVAGREDSNFPTRTCSWEGGWGGKNWIIMFRLSA
jgi:hypothetical protein